YTTPSGNSAVDGQATAGVSYSYVMTARGTNQQLAVASPCVTKDSAGSSASTSADNTAVADNSSDPGNTELDTSSPFEISSSDSADSSFYADDNGLSVDTSGSADGYFDDNSGLSFEDWGGGSSQTSDSSSDSTAFLDGSADQFAYNDSGDIIDTATGSVIDPNSSLGKTAIRVLHAKAAKTQQTTITVSFSTALITALIIGVFLVLHKRRAVNAFATANPYAPSPTLIQAQPLPVQPQPVQPAVDAIITNTFYPGSQQPTAPAAPVTANEPLDMYELANQHPETYGNMHNYLPEIPASQQPGATISPPASGQDPKQPGPN
ncbi:MAG: hypothetical protein JWO41_887, partial [Candidatus Saccharibacteria bacterium]|nr:hypothetical protein [Candidatus Saccharibacteria bacterium]